MNPNLLRFRGRLGAPHCRWFWDPNDPTLRPLWMTQKNGIFQPDLEIPPRGNFSKKIFYWSTHPKYGLKKTIHIFETPKLGNLTRWARPTSERDVDAKRIHLVNSSLGLWMFMGNITRLDYSNEIYKATCDWGRPHLMDDIDRPNLRSLHGVLVLWSVMGDAKYLEMGDNPVDTTVDWSSEAPHPNCLGRLFGQLVGPTKLCYW